MVKMWRDPKASVGWDSLIASIEMAYMRGAWHGKNLNSALKGIDAATAHRAVPGRTKTIWQITLHSAYWCYRVRVLLTGIGKRSFPRKGSDWLEQPEHPDPEQWKADVALVREEYVKLLDALVELREGRIKAIVPDDEVEYLISGTAFHAIYHASQISQFRLMLKDA